MMNIFDKKNINYSILAIFFLCIIIVMLFDQYNFLEYLFLDYDDNKKKKKIVENFNLSKEVNKITDKINDGIKKIDVIPEKIGSLGDDIEDGFKKIPKEVNKLGDSITNVANDLGNEIKSAADEAGKGFDKVGDEFEKVGETLSEIPPEVIDEIKGFVDDAVNEMEEALEETQNGVLKVATEIEKGTNKAVNEIEEGGKMVVRETWKAMKTVFEAIKKFFTETLACIFVEIGMLIYNVIVKPIIDLGVGIYHVFIELFLILMLIIRKIINLPGCSIYYFGDAMWKTIVAFFKTVTPKFIKDWWRFLVKWVIWPFWYYLIVLPIYYIFFAIAYVLDYLFGFINWDFDFVGFVNDPFGFNKARKECYAFPINKHMNNMKDIFIKIGKSFADAFGNPDFSKLAKCFS